MKAKHSKFNLIANGVQLSLFKIKYPELNHGQALNMIAKDW